MYSAIESLYAFVIPTVPTFRDGKRGQSTYYRKMIMLESVVNAGARFTVRLQPMYTTYGTKRRAGAAATMLYIRARKSGAVKVTAKGERIAGGKLAQSYQPDELYRTVTHCYLKSRQ